jgi:hypothetical protein
MFVYVTCWLPGSVSFFLYLYIYLHLIKKKKLFSFGFPLKSFASYKLTKLKKNLVYTLRPLTLYFLLLLLFFFPSLLCFFFLPH